MLKNLWSAGVAIASASAATAGGVHWSVDAPTTNTGGFVAYGVLFVDNGFNGPQVRSAATDVVNFFHSPFDLGGEIVDFGIDLPLEASEVGPETSTSGEMSQVVTVDGDGAAIVEVVASATGSTTHFGAASFASSSDPNDRAVAALQVVGADSSLPVRVFIAWSTAIEVSSAPGVVADGQLAHQLGYRRGGDVFFVPVSIEGIEVEDGALDVSGETTLVIAPGDDRAVEFSARTFGIVEFSAGPSAGVDGLAGAFSSVLTATFHVRQYCPGDTDGDDVVNFADLNEVLGSFSATGPLGEHAGDLNGDGVVNFADLNLVLANFGQQGC